MTKLYLIAHKVRGEPALDIAIQMDIVDDDDKFEVWWIIPTSGHRAYPYWHLELDNPFHNVPNMPKDLQDHYAVNDPTYKPPRFKIEQIDLDL